MKNVLIVLSRIVRIKKLLFICLYGLTKSLLMILKFLKKALFFHMVYWEMYNNFFFFNNIIYSDQYKMVFEIPKC